MADVTLEEWANRIEQAASGQLKRILKREMGKVSQRALGEAQKLAGTRMKVRTGRLWGSIRSEVKGEGKNIVVMLMAGGSSGGGQVRYARIQELGGQSLIPTGPRTRAGVQRFSRGPSRRGYIKPKYYLRDGMLRAAEKLPIELANAVSTAVHGIGGTEVGFNFKKHPGGVL